MGGTAEVDPCRPGLLLPAFDERRWSRLQRATLYFIGLAYTFLGVTVIMDVFMTAVETIITKKKKIYELRPELPECMQQKVWNDTVANLTIMAGGMSAPEIILSTMDIISNGFQVGCLGPGTIVGSGAINILTLAFCIIALPRGEVRRILRQNVFLVTGFFHLFSYLWLYLILEVISPRVVYIWEALTTLGMFPALILVSFAVSKDCWTRTAPFASHLRGDETAKEFAEVCFWSAGSINQEGLAHFVREVMKYPGMTMKDAALLAASKMVETESSPMWYRIGGARILTSGRPLTYQIRRRLKEVYTVLGRQLEMSEEKLGSAAGGLECQHAIIEFESPLISVTEAHVNFPVYIQRHGNMNHPVAVRVTSIDGMAVHGEDFVPINEIIVLEPHQSSAQINVRIIDENKYEPTEEFFLRLTAIQQEFPVIVGKVHIMEIKIIHDKSPGILEFEKRGIVVKESEEAAEVFVVRKRGSDGTISVSYTTSDYTAKAGEDYEGTSGELVFENGEVRKSLMIKMINTMSEEKEVSLNVMLSNTTGGAMLGTMTKMKIIITDDDDYLNVDNFIFMTNINVEKLKVIKTTWCRQIKEAMLPNGGNIESATNLDYFLHFLFFLWKVLFSLIPPPTLLNGWLSFVVSIAIVGLLATLMGDLASVFGCSIGLHDTLTALTFVAFGTSLTDVFACRFALIHGNYADSAIGNINGTAAINVYLGFGLPWTMATIYNFIQGKEFKIPKESGLRIVVIGYLIAVTITLSLLQFRRKVKYFGKAEIGGPTRGRYLSAVLLVAVWSIYMTICYLQIQGYISIR